MESSTKDKAAGAFHELKGTAKEVAGIVTNNPELEAEGTGARIAGKNRLKIGQFNQFWGK